jgi:hypothetical protein
MVFFNNYLNSCDFLKKMSNVVFHSSVINSYAVDIFKIIKKKNNNTINSKLFLTTLFGILTIHKLLSHVVKKSESRKNLIRCVAYHCILGKNLQQENQYVASDLAKKQRQEIKKIFKDMTHLEVNQVVSQLFKKTKKDYCGLNINCFNNDLNNNEQNNGVFQIHDALYEFRNSYEYRYFDFLKEGNFFYCFLMIALQNIFYPLVQYIEFIINYYDAHIKKHDKYPLKQCIYDTKIIDSKKYQTIVTIGKALSIVLVISKIISQIVKKK